MSIKGLGWIGPSLPDARDYEFLARGPILEALPSKVDLREMYNPPVVNQLSLGSCTACASVQAHLFEQVRQKKKITFGPSRLFVYYNTRSLMGKQYIGIDSGAYIRTAIKSIAQFGACPEIDWKYKLEKFATKPPRKCYATAEKNQALVYRRVQQTEAQLKAALASGHPVVFGFSVYESFGRVGKDGLVALPDSSESFEGGHAVLLYGYDDSNRRFLVLNSWGKSWGDQGFCHFPYSYLVNPKLASDFWLLETVE